MRHKTFIRHFFAALLLTTTGIVGFVTWVDPFRNLGFPWAIPFVSDRNIAYKKFILLGSASGVTDLVIGSSTSEAFVPQVLKERFGVQAFSASVGGASLPLRYLLIRQALRTQPGLKRIIYVADFFEFAEAELDTSVYYQHEMINLFDKDLLGAVRPPWADRFNDYSSYLVIDRSIRTLKDYRAHREGRFASAYHADGSTTRSMLGGRSGGTIEERSRASAVGMESIYGNLSELSPVSRKIFGRIVRLVKEAPGVELHVIASPFHPVFFKHFEARFRKTGAYDRWLSELKSHATEGRVLIHEFPGLESTDRYWQDGVHITSEAMLLMAGRIYGPKSGKPKPSLF